MKCSKCGKELRAYFKVSGSKIFDLMKDGSLGETFSTDIQLDYKYLTCECTPCPYESTNTLGTQFQMKEEQS